MVGRLPSARESSMRTINPTIATTITMTTTLGSLKLPLATTTAAAIVRVAQSGLLRYYALALMTGVTALALYFLIVSK